MALIAWTSVWLMLVIASGLLAFEVVPNSVPLAAGMFMLFAVTMAALGPLGVAVTHADPGGSLAPRHRTGGMSDAADPSSPT